MHSSDFDELEWDMKRMGFRVMMTLLVPVAAVPFVASILAEAWVIASITGWDFGTVAVWQLVPFLVVGFVAGLFRIWSGGADHLMTRPSPGELT